ncbi:DoxX family membrane protein [Leptospira bourretii]|uniref:DoxX family membrane protein n=1 Tax=Leptospira bourretii TaxID=2484962 RepID=A0A4R9IHX8_9LEPT|nr:DoxX family membrane protein [Leptospira bourretii]TGK88019.1 DoxX family membrane protein [Leptospira bourretii]TGK88669.1 DoxX family membrane protein [Leptospira bourretii]TGL38012.1 DoxX family membrane protein [Leptospira bourretii]
MSETNPIKRNIFQTVLRILLGAFLVFAGAGHLTWHRTEFLAQVPTWLPINADLVVLLSGAVEIVLGLSLIFLRSKQAQVGWVVALFFVLIFPGNISQYVNGISAFGLDTDRARLIRLFFQPVLVLWAIWSCGSWVDFQAKRKN